MPTSKSSKLEEVIETLPHLKKRDLELISAATSHLMRKKPGIVEIDPDETYVFEALKNVLGLSLNLKRLKTSCGGKQWDTNWPIFNEFMKKTFPAFIHHRRKLLALACYVFDLILRDVKSRGLVPTPGLMISHIIRVTEVFDHALPGYRRDKAMMLLIANLVLSGKRYSWGNEDEACDE